MKIVIDTSILIDKLRGGRVWRLFRKGVDENTEFFISSIVIFELFLGLSTRKQENVQKIFKVLKYFKVVDINSDIARRAAEINRDYVKDIEAADCLIASTTLILGAQVVTLNQKHFEKIPGLLVYPL